MEEHHSYPQYVYPGEHDQMFDSTRMAPPNSSWGQRELPGLRNTSYLAYPDHRPTPASYRAPSMNYHRIITGSGLDHDHLSSLAPRNQSSHTNEALNRFYNEQEAPWNPIRSGVDTQYTRGFQSGTHFPSPNLSPSYRQGPESVESSDTGPSHSDSGYHTAQTFSTVAMESLDRPEFPDISQRISGLQIPLHHVTSHRPNDDRRSDPGRTYSRDNSRTRRGHTMRRSNPEKCPHPGCGEISKCPSDMKKHMLKHDKPFKCDVKNCKRQAGFTTINDLNRHKKSVHKSKGTTKSFKCAAQHCKNRDKEWPRLDNFKQHVMRMHADEDLDDVIKRSECRNTRDSRSLSSTPQPATGSMDRTLAGMDDMSRHLQYNSSPSSAFSPEPNTKQYEPATTGASTGVIFDDYNHRHNGYEPYGGNFRSADANVNELQHKVSPTRTERLSTGSSSGLNALAAAAVAEGNSIDNIPDPVSRTGLQASASNHHGNMDPRSERQRHKTKPLALEITVDTTTSSSASEEVSEGRVLEIVTSATKADKLLSSTSSSKELSFRSPGEHNAPRNDDNDADPLTLGTISQAELKKTIAILSEHLKQKNKKRNSPPSRTNTLLTERTKRCTFCAGSFSRSCDLRKHERRHKKPYGCTYPKCHKVFGSKSDWKRHENSQHFQAEVFRCQIKKISLGSDSPRPSDVCGELLHKREDFQEHLQREHQLSDDAQIQRELKANRIGRNGQSKFWCGFCVNIVELKMRRAAAWDERFNHIDHHFMKQDKKVDDWWCMEACMTKGEVRKQMDKSNFDDVDEGTDDSPTEPILVRHSPVRSQSRERTPTQSSVTASLSPDQPSSSPSNKRKRQLHEDHYATGPRRPDIVMYCCRCGLGPYSRKLYMSCLQCEHAFCHTCGRKIVENQDGEVELDFDIEAHVE